jgi:transposase|tara:strand:- start:1330 stop:1620 length:291 start_codon:yes stop_codon:yes gene_type:complete
MSKGKAKQKFTNEFKLNVVIEGYATGNFSQVSARHGVHMTQIAKWKQQLLGSGNAVYGSKKSNRSEEQVKIDQMEKTIGRLALENDILKKTQELIR